MDLKLDIYEPEARASGIPVPATKPAYILMHGGGNSGGNKGGINANAAKWWAQRGFVVFDINYRLSGNKGLLPSNTNANASLQWQPYWASTYPAIRDAKAAIRFVRANANQFGIDPWRIAASGGSAGATDMLAAGVAFDDEYKDEITTNQDSTLASTNLQESSSVQCLVLHWAHEGGVTLVEQKNSGRESRFRPGNPPIVAFHGDQDTTIPIEHAYTVQQAYATNGNSFELHVLSGCNHGAWCYNGEGVCSCSGATWSPLMEELALPMAVSALDLVLMSTVTDTEALV